MSGHPQESTHERIAVVATSRFEQDETMRIPASSADPDVIVIGAGHNGLIAAAYLAKSGLDVVVLEARSDVGGCSSTETFAGSRVNICNCDHITFRTTSVMEELDLGSLGLEYVDVDPGQINVPWNGGPAWAIFRSVEKTLDSLSKVYPREVAGYRRYCREALPIAQLVLEAGAFGPRRLDLMRALSRSTPAVASRLLTWNRRSSADVMRSFFSSDELIAPAMATGPVVWGLSPETPGTGLGALTYAFKHVAGVGRPLGGSGRLAEVLAMRIRSYGSRVLTGRRVTGLLSDREGVHGVRLSSGEEIRSRIIVSAVDPHRTFVEWLSNPPRSAERTVNRWMHQPAQEGYESKIDAVISVLPEYRAFQPAPQDAFDATWSGATTVITPSLAEIHQAHVDMTHGRVASRPVMFANVPSVHDPSMIGENIGKHVFSLEVLFTPYSLEGGWPESSEPQRWLEIYNTLLDNDILAGLGEWRTMTPLRYESEFHLPNGHATSFAGGPLSALKGRPIELTRYRTAVPGLYLCGAATFPGAGIWGASGRHCAREILGALRP